MTSALAEHYDARLVPLDSVRVRAAPTWLRRAGALAGAIQTQIASDLLAPAPDDRRGRPPMALLVVIATLVIAVLVLHLTGAIGPGPIDGHAAGGERPRPSRSA